MLNADDVSGESQSTKTDPTYLKVLMEKLEPFLTYQNVAINTRYTLSAKQSQKCYFLKSGAISMHRQPHDILVELFEAPTLRGAIPLPHDSQSFYVLKVITESEIAIINREDLFDLLSKHRLWEIFSRHQLAIISRGVEEIFKLTTPSVYDVIRFQLYELANTSEEIRESITAESYIRSKTRVSRSSIMRVLTELKEGGYIVMERGKLKEVIKLPKSW